MIMTTRIATKEIIQFLKNSQNGFERVLQKVKIISAGEGACVAELELEEEHTNTLGGLHGGLSATLVDIISTYALMTAGPKPLPTVSVDMHMTYTKSAKLGDEIIIDAKTVRAGRTLAFLDVLIKNKANNEVLVKGSHTKFILQEK